MRKRRRRYLTLIEIMIVIALIGLIGSVVAYNLKGSLDEGKAFKTAQAMEQIKDVLWLEVARGSTFDDVAQRWEAVIKGSPIVKNGEKLVEDGWNQKFRVSIENDDFIVSSDRYAQYQEKRGH